jgi:hypothetical protein
VAKPKATVEAYGTTRELKPSVSALVCRLAVVAFPEANQILCFVAEFEKESDKVEDMEKV